MHRTKGSKSILGEIYIIFASILWGTTGTSQALAPENAHPLSIAALRIIVGGFILLVIVLVRKRIHFDKTLPITSTIISAISVAAYQLFFFSGVIRTGVAIGTVIGIGSSPIFGGALGFLFRKEPFNWRWFIATLTAILGIIFLVFTKSETIIDPLGILLALCAGFSYAVYVFMSKKVLDTQPVDAALAIIFTTGGLLLLPLLFNLGITTVAIAYTLFAQGLNLLPVSDATTLTLAEPLTAGLLGIFLLKEEITISILLGMLLVFIGLLILVWKPNAKLSSEKRLVL